MAFCIQLGVFSSQVFQESSQHKMWRRKHCNISTSLVYFEPKRSPLFLLVLVVVLTCYFYFLPLLQLHYMAWRNIAMQKSLHMFHACHHQNMVLEFSQLMNTFCSILFFSFLIYILNIIFYLFFPPNLTQMLCCNMRYLFPYFCFCTDLFQNYFM